MKIFEDWPYFGVTTKVVEMRKAADVFIRFGFFETDPSLNWSTGEQERGLSVYPACLVDGVATVCEDWTFDLEANWDALQDRTRYVVTGKVIGKGSDGEPILRLSSVVIRGIDHPKLKAGIPIFNFAFES